LEQRSGRIGPARVVTGNDDSTSHTVDDDLSATQDVTARNKRDCHISNGVALSVWALLIVTGGFGSKASLHHSDRLARRENRTVTRPSMVGMSVRDDSAVYGSHRIDMEPARHAVKARRIWP
jgi:hypothetical protein